MKMSEIKNQIHAFANSRVLDSYKYDRTDKDIARFELFNLGWSQSQINWLSENIAGSRDFCLFVDLSVNNRPRVKLQFFVGEVDFDEE